MKQLVIFVVAISLVNVLQGQTFKKAQEITPIEVPAGC